MTDEELKSYEAHKKACAKALVELEAENKKVERITFAAFILSIISITISVITMILKLLSYTG